MWYLIKHTLKLKKKYNQQKSNNKIYNLLYLSLFVVVCLNNPNFFSGDGVGCELEMK